jgi:hypothetical protein
MGLTNLTGGLSCAISCLKEGLEVEILEKSKVLGEVQLKQQAHRFWSVDGFRLELEYKFLQMQHVS